MPNVLASVILNQVSVTLHDPGRVRWKLSELESYLNDGQRAIVELKPTAYVSNGPIQLVAGTRQELPEDAISLLRVERNLGVTGTTIGPAVTLVHRSLMDSFMPNWHTARPSPTVQHYMRDDEDKPSIFYIYPPQPAVPSKVQAVYSAVPPTVTSADPIALATFYVNPLTDYILYRAYSKDVESNPTAAVAHYQAFTQALVGKASAEAASSPNTADNAATS